MKIISSNQCSASDHPFFEANKNQYNESIHLILGCSKNYHEIEEGSKPRWVSWGGKNQY